MRKTFKQAFTLAEVLIVLGIIGIVASMTIPTLMNKVAKQEYVTALKKFYSTQTDGWSRLLADEGVQQLEDTSVFQNLTVACGPSNANNTSCKPFFESLRKYFRFSIVHSTYYYYSLGGAFGNTVNWVLALDDGSILFDGYFNKTPSKPSVMRISQIAKNGKHMYSTQAQIIVDVNGFKKPNTWGRDIFRFEL